jgi:hypothetical protein
MHCHLCRVLLPLLSALLVGPLADSQAAETPRPPATTPAPGLPAVDVVLERWVQALGGRAALEQLTSRVIEGEVELSLAPGTMPVQVFTKAPDRQLSIITLPGAGELIEGYDGTNGWVRNPFAGLSDRSADELPKVRRDAQFNRELRLQAIYPDLAVRRVERVGTEDAFVAESRPTPRSLERFYFGRESGLLLRQDSEFDLAGGRVSATALYEDYRGVAGGVRVPHGVRIRARGAEGAEMTLTVKVKNVKHNVPVDDARFRKPAA